MPHAVTINRRMFLKGAGALIALPFLESMSKGAVASRSPTRFCFLYVPNGMSMEDWRPHQHGPLVKNHLPAILRPLAEHLDNITIVSGLDNTASEQGGRPENTGQHARSIGAFLSGAYPTKNIRAGETIDVVLARNLTGARIPLLNLATEYAEDEHDLDYSPVFNYSLSWKNDRTPIQPIESPDYAFQLLCGDARTPAEIEAGLRQRRQRKKSILDAVLESSKALQSALNPGDRANLDEHLESIRSIERELDSAAAGVPAVACKEEAALQDATLSFEERLRMMLDLLHLALKTNSTRVATLMFGAERSERDFGFLSSGSGLDMSGGHHSISHHKNNARQIQRFVRISAFHSHHLARFLQKLKSTRDGEGNLLESTFILYGSSMADGNTHEHHNLPILIAGKGNGLIGPGRNGFHVDYGGRPLSNLYLTLLQRLSIADAGGRIYSSFGDSGGTLDLPGGL
jgi:hypothetical protein